MLAMRKVCAALLGVLCALGLLVVQATASNAAQPTQFGQLKNLATGECLGTDGTGGLTMSPCAQSTISNVWSAQRFEYATLNNSAIIYNTGACVVRSNVTTKAELLKMGSCASTAATLKTWKIHDLGVTGGHHYTWIGPAGGSVRMDADTINAYSNLSNNGSYQKWVLNPICNEKLC